MLAVGHRHPPEILARRPGHVQVALRRHGHPRGRSQQPHREVGRHVRVLGVRQGWAALHAGAEAAARPFVEGAVADDDVGHAGGDRQRCLLHGGAGGAAAVVDAAEERQVADAQAACDVDVGIGVRAEGHHPLDLGGSNAGIGQRGGDRLDGQAQLGAARILGELGGADAGDGGPAGEGVGVGHHAPASATGNSTVTVPVTWSPRLLAPRSDTVTEPYRPSSLNAPFWVTDPVNVMMQSG